MSQFSVLRALLTVSFAALISGTQLPAAGPADAGGETAPAALYVLDEGSGDVATDRSGNARHGKIHGATWQKVGDKTQLRFDGRGDWIDLGNWADFGITSEFTVAAWVTLDASPFPDGDTNWSIIDCERYRESGFLVRIDGAAGTVLYRNSGPGTESVILTTRPLANHGAYHVALIHRDNVATLLIDGLPVVSGPVNQLTPAVSPLKISSESQSFHGLIHEVKLYNRALESSEVIHQYRAGASAFGKDTSSFGKLAATPFVYIEEGRGLVDVDFSGIAPLAEGERVVIELAAKGNPQAMQTHEIRELPEMLRGEYAMDLKDLSPGEYEFRLSAVSDAGEPRSAIVLPFRHAPDQAPDVPSPAQRSVAALPVPPTIPEFGAQAAPDGALRITVAGQTLELTSEFSAPNGAFHRLGGAISDRPAAPWNVRAGGEQIVAKSNRYRLERSLTREDGRLLIKDTLTNVTDEPIGIIFNNRISGKGFASAFLAGNQTIHSVSNRPIKTCPVTMLSSPDLGVGAVPLDDVFIVQSRADYRTDDNRQSIAIGSKEFALDAGASYTLEWAVYFNSTGGYYDLINAVRRDEGRNNVTVDSGFAMMHGTQTKRDIALAPSADYYEIRGGKNAIIFCLSWAADDPGVSIEGIEFKDFPKEMEALKALISEIKRKVPDARPMFHIAQSLYATNRPDQIYADSRVIQVDGTQAVYAYDYGAGTYFSKERYADNWRWWIYYPTLDNTFGQAMLDSVDLMMDQLGAKGAFVDGFFWAYGGEYTYDRWDGHTADIDPATHELTRKKGSVLLLSQEAMIAYARKIMDKGGVCIANNTIPTRSVTREPIIIDKEITEGPYVHLAPTPIAMGNPAAIKTEVDVYRDVLAKLRWGNLYMYYGDPRELTYPSVPKQMYPITVQKINAGGVTGRERIITMNGGVYGWAGDRDLHQIHRYDARGHEIDHAMFSTVDADSVRTEVTLDADESAVVKKIPVSLDAASAVNALVMRYDAEEFKLVLNGQGKTGLILRNGAMPIIPGRRYTTDGTSATASDAGEIRFDLDLNGPVLVQVKPEAAGG